MINWGIIGLGTAATNFANCFAEVRNAKISAIASLDPEKIKKFKGYYGEVKSYLNYDELINDKNINAIYIATVNHLHYELVKKSAFSNKNILCEKPIGINFNQVKDLYQIVKDKNIKCAEAIAYYLHPQILEIKKLIKENAIGDLLKIECYFGYKSRFIANSRIYSQNLGGGALLDLGCYPISFLMLFAKNISSIKFIKKNITISKTNVDDYADAELVLDDKVKAKIFISIRKKMKNICKIYGTKGLVEIMNPWLPGLKEEVLIRKKFSIFKKTLLIKNNFTIYGNQLNILSNCFKDDKKKYDFFDIDKSIICHGLLNEWKCH